MLNYVIVRRANGPSSRDDSQENKVNRDIVSNREM